MPKYDSCQELFIRAFRKDGWNVTISITIDNDPDDPVYIDLRLSRLLNGIQSLLQIYIEVKCFSSTLKTHDVYAAIGQYLVYRTILARNNIATPLFLALPSTVYAALSEAVRELISLQNIKCVTIDVENEKVAQWIGLST
jgi:hypothetical protein